MHMCFVIVSKLLNQMWLIFAVEKYMIKNKRINIH